MIGSLRVHKTHCHICGEPLKEGESIRGYSSTTGKPSKIVKYKICPNWRSGYFESNGHFMQEIVVKGGNPFEWIFGGSWSG